MCIIRRFKCLKKSAQVNIEFAILVVVIMIALIFMGSYLKRGIQGRLRETADDIGSLYNPLGGTEIDNISNFEGNEITTELTTTENRIFGGVRKTKDVTTAVTGSIESSRVTVNEKARLVDIK